jgi:LmbE family N-acetylglucosaminyl deacetylase
VSADWLVVSPHCDDAVLACGDLIARHPGSIVVTVFAGSAPDRDTVSEWDRSSGFTPGDDVMALRRREDAEALSLLGAQPVWLPFMDSQYGGSPSAAAVARRLRDVLRTHAPRSVAFPLGLFHSDHLLARDAALLLSAIEPAPRYVLYLDALYRRIPGAVPGQLAALRSRGFRFGDARLDTEEPASAVKRAAVECYRSQLRALATPGRPGHRDAYEPERYFELVVPVASV